MHAEFHVKSYGLSVTVGRYQKVRGICSQLTGDWHFLMWDFDGRTIEDVEHSLITVQNLFHLPPIHIIQSSEGDKFHAYCFARYPFEVAIRVLASTKCIDTDYLAIGILRGYWTLRITPKTFLLGFSSEFRKVKTLRGHRDADVIPEDCQREVTYWTRLD